MAVKEYRFVPEAGAVRVTSDLNVRKNSPTRSSDIALILHAGTTQSYIGYVLDGEAVNTNPKWFLTPEGNFFWSGNVDTANVPVSGKILGKPLDQLICTQRFGERPEVYASLGSPKGHNGMDFRTRDLLNVNEWKKPVYAVLEGVVTDAAEDPTKGKYVRIWHTNGYESVYLHLSALEVKKDMKVEAGAKIGISGNSGGASEAPHLHFGYRPQKFNKDNGYMGYIDPAPYFIDEIKYV